MAGKIAYDLAYYQSEALDPELRSPAVVVPLVVSLLHPKSVVDVGCGVGHWLSVFKAHGVERVLGLDGKHIEPKWLVIPTDTFRSIDLARPFRLKENFDLAVCLEVAEHLPNTSAAGFVESLVRLAPAILFSAAIPMQGGTQHVNEQWPDYWRNLFQGFGYRRLDLIRKSIWKNPDVKFWYRQNIFLFVSEDLLAKNLLFQEAAREADDLLLVHGSTLRELLGLRSAARNLSIGTWRLLKRKTRALFGNRSGTLRDL
ncbi:MAG: methyltransferase domain-containing protein [Candidatus Acidiferrales bacterium]